MGKGNKYFSKLLYLYIITAFIGANIAIGFIAISHIICFAIIVVYFFNIKKNFYTELIIYNHLLYSIALIIILISISIFCNIKEQTILMYSLIKLKYFFAILVLIYTVDRFKHKIEPGYLSMILIFLASIVCIYGVYQNFATTERIGSFAGVMNGPHNISVITLILLALVYLKKIKFKYLLISILVVSGNLLVLYSSETRGAWIAFIGGVLTLLLLSKCKFRWKILFLIVPISLAFSNLDELEKILIDDRNSSNMVRYSLACFGVEVMTENPITGIGYKQFGKYFQENHSRFGINPISPTCSDHAHNTYIQIGATTGIPTLVVTLCFFFFWIKLNFRNQENKIIFIPTIISVILSGLTHNNLGIAQNMTLITLLFVINIVSIKMESFRKTTPHIDIGT